MTQRIEQTIEQFLLKQENNRDGVVYNTVNVDDREFVKDVLTRFYPAFESLFQSKDDAEELFCERLMRLTAIRIDNKDENLLPLKFVYDDVRRKENGTLRGGVTHCTEHGLFIFDMDYMALSIDEAKHTMIHELIHLFAMILMTDKDGSKKLMTGLTAYSQEEFMNFLNEGFTELIAQILWSKMYPDKKCPGIGRYGLNVDSVKLILKQFVDKEQIVEDYIVDAHLVIDRLKNQVDINNNDMFSYISKASKKDIRNVEIQKEIAKNFKNFIYTNQNKII